MPSNLSAQDILVYRLPEIREEKRKKERGPGEIRIPVGAPPDNWLYNALADRKLNEALKNVGENLIGEGTGSFTKDILAGALGGGAGIATEAMGGQSGAIDWIPGGGLTKAVLVGLPATVGKYTGKVAGRLKNPIARRLSQRYGDEAVERLDEFLGKHRQLESMNAAEVNDLMESGVLGNKFVLDVPATYDPGYLDEIVNGKSYRRGGTGYSLDQVIDEQEALYPPGIADMLRDLRAETKSALARGDMGRAFKLQAVTDKIVDPSVYDGTPNVDPSDIHRRIEDQMDKFVKARTDDEYVHSNVEDPLRRNLAEKVSEYMHLQEDPIAKWRDIVYMDDNAARIMAQRQAEQSAQKEASLARREAAEQAKKDAEYEKRLKEYRKNPEKSRKTAKSAAPKMVRDKGEKEINLWYYGVEDPSTVAKTQSRTDARKAANAERSAERELEKQYEKWASGETERKQMEAIENFSKWLSGADERNAARATVHEAPKAVDILGGPGKWRENGWKSDDHLVREPGMGYPVLGSKATEDDRRALFVLDSLANVAADKLVRNKVNMDSWPGMSAFRHRGTNYDAVGRMFGEDVKKNAATGNLPEAPMFTYRTAISSAGNRLPGQMDAILNMDGEKSMYDKLLRAKIDRKLNEMDRRYRPSSIFGY